MATTIPRATSLAFVAEILLKLVEDIPQWQGPTRTQFQLEITQLVRRVEEAHSAIEAVVLAEIVAETAAEAALV